MKYLKIIIFSFFILFYLQSVVAQNNYVTCVTYKVDRYTAIGEKDIHNNEILNAFRTLEYQLVYNKTKSIYQPVQKLSEVETDVHYKIAQMIARALKNIAYFDYHRFLGNKKTLVTGFI